MWLGRLAIGWVTMAARGKILKPWRCYQHLQGGDPATYYTEGWSSGL